MYDDFINIADKINCSKIYLTTHYAYITHPNFENEWNYYFNIIFKPVIYLQKYLTFIALSQEVANVYIRHGLEPARIRILRNGAREDSFMYTITPSYPNKSIYVGKIEMRKSQYKYQCIPGIYFAGNFQNSSFDCYNQNYLGEWSKEMLYNNLTQYGNLILLSDGEADPLVVKEALIAGLGIVVSECAKANLDLSKPFIDVIPNEKLNDIEYVSRIIEKNREVCKKERENIRKYGLEIFSWKNIISEYLNIIQ